MTDPCSYPQKVGKGLFSYITYRVYTCIGLDRMAKNEYTVYRRYRDFLQLHEKLEDRCGLVLVSAVKRSIGSTTGCTIMEKAPTRAFS